MARRGKGNGEEKAAAAVAEEPPDESGLEVNEKAVRPVIKTVRVKLPLLDLASAGGEEDRAYRSRHVEARLDGAQAETMKRLFRGLDQVGARLANGRRVGSNADAVRWVLEQVGGAG